MSFISFDAVPWHAGTVNIPTARRVMRPQGLEIYSRQALPEDELGYATMTITGVPLGCDVFLLKAGTNEVIAQFDQITAVPFTYLYPFYTAPTIVDIGFIKLGLEPKFIRAFPLPSSSFSIPVELSADRNFQ